MNENGISRENLVYSASHYSRSDLVMDLWGRVKNFLEVAHWAYNRQIQIGIRGYATRRYSTLERILKRKAQSGEIRDAVYNQSKVYAQKMKTKGFTDTAKIYHGLCCTECLIRFMTAKEGEPIAERHFRRYGRVPEFGIRFENGKLLLLEFSTKHDVTYTGKIRGKLNGYGDCLREMERDFNVRATVVFVLDVPRDRVRRIVETHQPSSQFGSAILRRLAMYLSDKR
jgi:hypothetical protein